MAKIKGPLLSASASGRFAGVLSFRDTRHGPVASRYHYPGSRNVITPSQAQLDWRALYGALVADWRALTQPERDQWNALASPLRLSGWALYVRDNISVPPPPPITQSLLDFNSTTLNGTSYNSSSILPGGDKLILAVAGGTSVSSGDNVIPTVSGNGLTWVLVASSESFLNYGRISCFRAMGSAPSPGQVNFLYSAVQNDLEASIHEFDNVDAGGTNGSAAIVQSVPSQLNGSTSQQIDLAPFGDIKNATFGAFALAVANATAFSATPGSGFTEISDQTILDGSYSAGVATEWRDDNDTSVDISWSKSGNLGGIALEIKSAP